MENEFRNYCEGVAELYLLLRETVGGMKDRPKSAECVNGCSLWSIEGKGGKKFLTPKRLRDVAALQDRWDWLQEARAIVKPDDNPKVGLPTDRKKIEWSMVAEQRDLGESFARDPETLFRLLHALDRGDETYFLYLALEVWNIREWLKEAGLGWAGGAMQPMSVPDAPGRVQEAWPWADSAVTAKAKIEVARRALRELGAAPHDDRLLTQWQEQREEHLRVVKDCLTFGRQWEFQDKIRSWRDAEETGDGDARLEGVVARVFSTDSPADPASTRTTSPIAALAELLYASPKSQSKLALLLDKTPSRWLRGEEAPSLWKRREMHHETPAAPAKGDKEHGEPWDRDRKAPDDVTGLCFSGGGIRSATFNLGMLQALAELKLLDRFDYLSTVSGGGYIHQWIAAWLKREAASAKKSEARGKPYTSPYETVRKALEAQPSSSLPGIEATQISFLRTFSNYLTPRVGAFTADTWTMISIWLRNTFLVQLILGSTLLTVLSLVKGAIVGLGYLSGNVHSVVKPLWTGSAWFVFIAALSSLAFSAYPLHRLRQFARQLDAASCKPKLKGGDSGFSASLFFMLVAAALFAAFCTRWNFWPAHANDVLGKWTEGFLPEFKIVWGATSTAKEPPQTPAVAAALVNGLLWIWRLSVNVLSWLLSFFAMPSSWLLLTLTGWPAIAGCVGFAPERYEAAHPVLEDMGRPNVAKLQRLQIVATAIVAGGTVFFLLTSIFWLFWRWVPTSWNKLDGIARTELPFVLVPPVLLAALFLTSILHVGLNRRVFRDEVLEWMARLRGLGYLVSLGWLGASGCVLLGGLIVHSVVGELHGLGWGSIAAAAWSGISGWGAKAAKGGRSGNSSFIDRYIRPVIVAIAPWVFVGGLLIATSALVQAATDGDSDTVGLRLLVLTLISATFAGVYGYNVDINEMSMYAFYRNRLARCYQGASVIDRQPDPFTGFSRDDRSIGLAELRHKPPAGVVGVYPGPFPIFCCTLNFSSGEDLAWQERKGASFAYTPLYSGYDISWTGRDRENDPEIYYSGFRDTVDLGHPLGPSLADACAVSGAAVSPEFGYNTKPGLAFLMTCFNVRLGAWRRNTRWEARSSAARQTADPKTTEQSPRWGLFWLLNELLAKTNANEKFLYLTDGGHFDNMGLYELVRRECRYIVICDAESDGELAFEGLAMAIRKCRTDFGVDIQIDVTKMRKGKDAVDSGVHCVVGTILYPNDDPQMKPRDRGKIVYLKSTLTGNEPADLLSYRLKHPEFPHDTTADQWFSESQFESYRTLGRLIGLTSLKSACKYDCHGELVYVDRKDFFERMYDIWYPSTPAIEQHLSRHGVRFEALVRELRTMKDYAQHVGQMFDPEVTTLSGSRHPGNSEYQKAFALSIYDFIWQVFNDLDLHLASNREHPHAEVWMQTFHRWLAMDFLQDAWSDYGVRYPKIFHTFLKEVAAENPSASFVPSPNSIA
jgi:hypothetical protein